MEGLKRTKVKPLNYFQVTVGQQGLDGKNKTNKQKKTLPFYSILRTLSESIPKWTQSHRWERFSSKINF
jgi:hypothetical protein